MLPPRALKFFTSIVSKRPIFPNRHGSIVHAPLFVSKFPLLMKFLHQTVYRVASPQAAARSFCPSSVFSTANVRMGFAGKNIEQFGLFVSSGTQTGQFPHPGTSGRAVGGNKWRTQHLALICFCSFPLFGKTKLTMFSRLTLIILLL